MAIGDGPTGPDFGAMLALNNFSSQGGGGGMKILAAIMPGGAKDVDVGANLSPKGKGLNSDNTFKPVAGAKPTLIQSLFKQMGITVADINKGLSDANSKGAVQAMPVQQVNSITEITGQAPQGGFAANLGPRGGGSIDM